MALEPQELREKAVKILEKNRGTFLSSSRLAELLNEDPERVTKLLSYNRPGHVLARPGGGGGFIVPSDDRGDCFQSVPNSFGRILRYLRACKGEFRSRYEIAQAVSVSSESVPVIIRRNRKSVPDGWKLEGRVGQYGGFRLVERSQ